MTSVERSIDRISSKKRGQLEVPPRHSKYQAQRVSMVRDGNTHVFRADNAVGNEFQVWKRKKIRRKNIWINWKEPMNFQQREYFVALMDKSLDTNRDDLKRLLSLARACHEGLTTQESTPQA